MTALTGGAPGPENTGFGIFGGCRPNDSTPATTSHKYDFVTAVTSATTSLVTTANGSATGSGNTEVGLINSAYTNGATVSKYTISTMAVITGPTLTLAYDSMFAGSVSSDGYWMGGNTSGTLRTTVKKYTYSSNTWANLGVTNSPQHRGASHNNTQKMFLLSGGTTNTNITSQVQVFNFSTETFLTSTTISVGRSLFNGAAGTQEKAIILGGSSGWPDTYTLNTEKIMFSDNTKTATQSITQGRRSHNATGNEVHGIWAGGISSGATLASTIDFTFNTDTHTAGSNLPTASAGMGAFSSSQIR